MMRRLRPSSAVRLSIGASILGFSALWGAVWALQMLIDPGWLIGDRADFDAVLGVVPETIVAVFVLVLGSLFVVAQQAAAAHGTRAPLMLIYDPHARSLVVAPLLLSAGALALTGVAYERLSPPDWQLAASTTLVLATCATLIFSAARLFSLLLQYTAPVNFAKVVLRGVDLFLEAGATGMVVFRIGLLGEMGRTSLRRADTPAVNASLQGLWKLADMYIESARANPEVREHAYDSGPQTAWMGDELRAALGAMGIEALTQGAPEDQAQAITQLLAHFGTETIKVGWQDDCEKALLALVELGTAVQQVMPSGAVNLYAPAAFAIARIQFAAENNHQDEIAITALGYWLLIISYWVVHFGINEEAALQRGIYDLGPNPRWHDVADTLLDDEFERRWLNKMPNGPLAVVGTLGQAQHAHSAIHGRDPDPPPEQTFADLESLVNRNDPGRWQRLLSMLPQISEDEHPVD
jgi:hypothetical protein